MEEIWQILKENLCCYCKKELDQSGWVSHWGDCEEQHYKIVHCPHCRKKNWVRVDFYGSGHDFLFKKELSPLESTVKKVRQQ